jgi:hypothetical protein
LPAQKEKSYVSSKENMFSFYTYIYSGISYATLLYIKEGVIYPANEAKNASASIAYHRRDDKNATNRYRVSQTRCTTYNKNISCIAYKAANTSKRYPLYHRRDGKNEPESGMSHIQDNKQAPNNFVLYTGYQTGDKYISCIAYKAAITRKIYTLYHVRNGKNGSTGVLYHIQGSKQAPNIYFISYTKYQTGDKYIFCIAYKTENKKQTYALYHVRDGEHATANVVHHVYNEKNARHRGGLQIIFKLFTKHVYKILN